MPWRTISHSVRTARAHLNERVDGDVVSWFRFVFGICGFLWAVKQLRSDALELLYLSPPYRFSYFGWEWVQPLGPEATRCEFYILAAAGLLIAGGIAYRLATLTFALVFTHLFLIDKCLYQNHYYLISLVAWLMYVVPLTRIHGPAHRHDVPRWALWLLRYQLALPYIYGSVAKWNPDWLAGEPIRSMLAQRAEFPLVGAFFAHVAVVYFFVWGGILFDLLVVPALLTPRCRLAASLAAILFHGTNANLFTIGVFPWFMLFATPLFYPPGSLRKLTKRLGNFAAATLKRENTSVDGTTPSTEPTAAEGAAWWRRLGNGILMLFVVVQAVLPLRHFAIPGNASWTEEGHCFAWHMLVRGKRCALRITATDRGTGHSGAVDLRPYLTPFQLPRVARDPRLILQLARHIERDLRTRGVDAVELRALALVSMNGRKPQHLVDPRVDLTQATAGWGCPPWIIPLREPLREQAWDQPISTWEAVVGPAE